MERWHRAAADQGDGADAQRSGHRLRLLQAGALRRAREAGLDEAAVEQIVDGYESSDLSDDQKLVLRFTDAFLDPPHTVDPELAAAMSARFSAAEITELGLALAMFLGMAKVLISLGTEPEEMEITVVPTPALARS